MRYECIKRSSIQMSFMSSLAQVGRRRQEHFVRRHDTSQEIFGHQHHHLSHGKLRPIFVEKLDCIPNCNTI